ncbi:MAG: hypothetical protein JWN07_1663 [Hyphomicrobiales bacterium]|nr:hypothetical protein [Hyphomicrobiales bacterium]
MTQDEALRALQALPTELRERALARLKDEAERLQVLKQLIRDGLDDAESGDVTDWDPASLLAELDDDSRFTPRTA